MLRDLRQTASGYQRTRFDQRSAIRWRFRLRTAFHGRLRRAPEGVGEELARERLVDEEPAGVEHAADLGEGLLGMRNVVAGAEVDDEIECAIRIREVAHVAEREVDVEASNAAARPRFANAIWVDIDACKPRRLQVVQERQERDSSATPNLNDRRLRGRRKRETRTGDLDVLLERVPQRDAGERRVYRRERAACRDHPASLEMGARPCVPVC